MSKYFTMGEEVTPAPRTYVNTPDLVTGPGWSADRSDEGIFLEWDAGQLMSKYVRVAITQEEFDRLRDDPAAFDDIWVQHDPNRADPGSDGS